MDKSGHLKTILASGAVGIFALIFVGIVWFFFLGPATPVGFGWYLFSFAAGLTMIVLPCTLPLAFVIVPLSMGKGAAKGLGIAIAFGLGVAATLSMYGVIAAVVGEVAIGTLGAPLETVKNWLYFFAGAAAYLFALGELGLIRVRMPTYTGAAPSFIQKQSDYLKALLLGLFLGNIGVGCPHPATPVILTRIAASGDVFYGWMLFFVHAVGRILPLLLLALLGILGVNALAWLVKRKEKVERATGWGMVFVAGFILVLGLFTHDWWVYSGQHTLLEAVTQEERFIGVVAERVGVAPPHAHGIPTGAGLFGLPLWLGNWALAGLWILPLAWYYRKKKKEYALLPEGEEKKIESRAMPLRAGMFLSLAMLIAVSVIWILPDRFLNHTAHQEGTPPAQGRLPAGMHADEHGATRYHEEGEVREGLAVNMNVTPVPVFIGIPARLDFFVNQKPGNIPVPASELEVEHTKLIHVIGVRNDMNEFFHIHPQPTLSSGVLAVDYNFSEPGRYKIWSEIKKDGVNHAFGHPTINIGGEGLRSQKSVSFARNVIVGDYQVALRLAEGVAARREAELLFDVHTLDSHEIELEPYLAADMHLAVIKDDLKQFLHTHPEKEGHHSLWKSDFNIIPEALANGGGHDTNEEGHGVLFRVNFPEPGLYKLFAQFRPRDVNLPPGEALTAAFWVEVQEKSPSAIPEWWRNLVVSAGAIVALSWGVKKFLQAKAQ